MAALLSGCGFRKQSLLLQGRVWCVWLARALLFVGVASGRDLGSAWLRSCVAVIRKQSLLLPGRVWCVRGGRQGSCSPPAALCKLRR